MDQTNQNPAADVQDVKPGTELVVLSPEQVIESAIKQFSETEATDAKIEEIKQIAATLSIAGVDDKAGYKKVDTARKRVKAIRLAVTNKETELLKLPKDFTAKVKAEAKRLVAALKPIEDELQLKQKAIDDVITEQKRKAKEAAEAEARKIAFREKALYDLGALRDGQGRFVVGEWAVTPDQIQDTEEEEFSLLLKGIEQTLPKPQPAEAAPAPSEPAPAATTPEATEPAPAVTPATTVSIPTRRTMPASAPNGSVSTAAQPAQGPNLQFAAGFEAAKRQVVAILQSPDKITRAELIEKINNLKP